YMDGGSKPPALPLSYRGSQIRGERIELPFSGSEPRVLPLNEPRIFNQNGSGRNRTFANRLTADRSTFELQTLIINNPAEKNRTLNRDAYETSVPTLGQRGLLTTLLCSTGFEPAFPRSRGVFSIQSKPFPEVT